MQGKMYIRKSRLINLTQHQNLPYSKRWLRAWAVLWAISCFTFTAGAQSLPNFTSVAGTQLTNTDGQWVTVNPEQPNNIDLIETRIFKMPAATSGVIAIEFKLEGADGGTARYQWGLNDKFSKGGGGGQVQFTLPLQGTSNYDRPFLVTFGKKGESKTIHSGFYVSAGGGGSTGMSWLVSGASAKALSATPLQWTAGHMIAAAGGGSGGFSFVFGTLNGNSAIRNAVTNPLPGSPWSKDTYSALDCYHKGERVLRVVSGGSTSRSPYDLAPNFSYCCGASEKVYATTSYVYSKLSSDVSPFGELTSVTFGQEGGKPVAIYFSQEGNTNLNGFGLTSGEYEKISIIQLGGKGGAGFGGGGAGATTTTYNLDETNANGYPTGGAGGTGSHEHPSHAHKYPSNGESGWNDYHPSLNATTGSRTQTDNPQSGKLMYRTIMDTEPPTVVPNSFITVDMVDKPWWLTALPLTKELLAPYIGQGKIISDNNGIKSITFHPSSVSCSDVGQTIPVPITVSDFAGNNLSTLIYITVTDSATPQRDGSLDPSEINVSSGPVTLTATHFPPGKDGCNGANVTVNFPPATFYCNDVGSRTIQFYYTDSDGNNSPVYEKTFNIVCSGPNTANQRYLYVDHTAGGSNDGLSWENAFTDLQSALNYNQIQSVSGIYVAKGTYRPTNTTDRNVRFELKDNIKLYGGFPNGGADFVNRNPETHPTVLSGEIGSIATPSGNSYYVVVVTGNNVHLEGVTVRDGDSFNTFSGGGGLWVKQDATSLTTDHRTTIRNVKFINNLSGVGGAVYGEHRNTNHTNYLSFENCLFENNNATGWGGAVYLNSETTPDNTRQSFVNCVFNNNLSGAGGAIYTSTNAQVSIVNCTFSANKATAGGGAIYNNGTVRLHNSILYFDSSTSGESEIENTGTFHADYSNIQGSGGSAGWSLPGVQDSGNNIDADPMFHTSPALSLLPQSPSRNMGKNDYNTEIYDIYGNNYRIKQDVIDMGAFETDFVVYVAADAPAGGDGTSWARAFNNLNDGISAAGSGVLQKDVWVKQGTYRPDRAMGSNTITPNNRENTFFLNYTLKIYGGFAGTENTTAQRNIGQNPTILSGDTGTPNNTSDNVYHVVYMQAVNARLDGLIIEGGNANGSGASSRGGGVYNDVAFGDASNVSVVANCVFRNNQAADKGGAWYSRAMQAGAVDFVQSVFYNNTATRGAAAYIGEQSHTSQSMDLKFYNITAVGNTSSASGAGAFEAAQFSSNPARITFYNSLLAGNTPQNYNDVTNPGLITLNNTYSSESVTNIFANPSNPAGADGKIMTADDGLQLHVRSPAIGYGSTAWLYSGNLDKDITGSQRILNQLDAGAYESPYNAPLIADGNAVIYVRPVAFGEGTGSSWENATSDLHNAIYATGVQKVFVAVGMYNVGDHSFIMKNGVEIYGGFDPENGIRDLSHQRIMPDPVRLYGDNTGSVLNGQNVRPVIWNIFNQSTKMDQTAVLDGFLLINGKHPTGGGVRNIHASPTLRNLVISLNRATLKGAGMYNENSSPVLTNVIISNNGINSILDPVGDVPLYGAGMYNTASSNPQLTNVTLTENYIRGGSAPNMLGAGMYNQNSSPVVRNSIIWNNHKSFNVTINGADFENEGTVNLSIKNSITQGYDTGNPADNNKVNVNPQFVSAGARDFRLSGASPAIDAGDNSLFPGLNAASEDLEGNPRVFGSGDTKKIDMGAYEYQCVPIDYTMATLEDLSVDYDGAPHSLTVQNLPSGVSATYEITHVDSLGRPGHTATKAGIYNVTATLLPAISGTGCTPLILSATLTIRKAATVITTDSVQAYVYDGIQKKITASINHTEAVPVYSPQQGYTDLGVYPVTVSVPETDNYRAATKTVMLVIENTGFTGITLNDSTFIYDGTPRSLAITGTLPEGTAIAYSGNGKTEAGTYTVNALIRKPNYDDLWLTATLTIEKAQALITADSLQTFLYDGTVKNVAASLNHTETSLAYLPQQGYTAVGTYPVIISAPATTNYLAAADTVSLVISNGTITGITLADSAFVYDGTPKSLAIKGTLPAGGTVSYTGNARTDAGTYTVNAQIKAPGYEDLHLPATLTIQKAKALITADDPQTFVYDGTVKNVVASLNHPETTLAYAPQQGYTAAGTYEIIISAPATANYLAAADTVSLVIESAGLTGISFKDSTVTYDGTPQSLAVSGTLPAGATVSYTGNAQTQAGSYTVTALIKVPNYQDVNLSATLTIQKAKAVITADTPQNFIYDGTVKNAVASLNHTETPLAYSPQQGYTATGTYEVIISAAATANYLATADTVSLVIKKGTVSGITLTDSSFTYDGTPKSLAIKGTLPAGGTVTYTGNAQTRAGRYTVNALIKAPNYNDLSLSAAMTVEKGLAIIAADSAQTFVYDGTQKEVVATLNHTETTLTYSPQQGYTAAGTYEVIISAAATANYRAAADTVTLVIESAGLAGISFKDSVVTYDGTPKSLAVSGALPAGAVVSYTGNAQTNAGSYTVNALIKVPNYQDVNLSATLTIQKAEAIITADAVQTFGYDGTVKNVVASLNHTETALAYSPQQGYTAAGTYEVIISADATANYQAAADTVSLVIESAGLTGISFKDSTATYDGTPKSLAISGTLPAGATVSYTGNAQTHAGTYTVNALIKVPNYQDVNLSATLTIRKAEAIITTDATQTFVYDGTVKNVVATLNHMETTLSYSQQQGYTAVGTYPVIITAAATANYLATADTVSLVIESTSLTGISLKDSTATYDGTPKSLAISGTLPADGTVSYTGNAKTDAGTYTVNALIKAPNYKDLNLSATLTIQKAKAIITADSTQTFVYDGTMKNVAATLNHTETTLRYSPQQGYTAAGTYEVIISAAATANYRAAADTVSLVIESAGLAGISFKDSTVTYDGAPKSLAISGTLPAGAIVSYTGNAKINAGSYTINALIKVPNYQDVNLSATLTIQKAEGIITADAVQTFVYDGTVKNAAASLNHTETPLTYSPQRGYREAGTYPIIISAAETANYRKAADTISLVIENGTVSGITLADAGFTYDGTPKSLAISGTLPAGGTVSYTGNAQTNAGTYTVNALIKAPNYNDLNLSARLTIQKAEAIITADSTQTFVYDGTVKNAVASLNHTEVVLIYSPQQGYSAVGTYEIMISAEETANYRAAADTVSLVIESAGLAGISFKDSTATYDGTPKSLAISGTLPAGATVSYTGNAKINAGIYTVDALIKVPNYNDVNLSATLTIQKAKAAITANNTQTFTYDGTVKNAIATLNHTEIPLTYYPQQGYTAVGNYEIMISAEETANYLAAADTVSLVIEKGTVSGITLADASFTYDGTPKSLAVTGTLPAGATVSYTGNAQTGAGSYTVNALVKAPDYNDLNLSATLTIQKAKALITADNIQNFVYDGTQKNVTATLNHTEAPLAYAPQQGYTAAGSYEIIISAQESPNYLAAADTVSLVIESAGLTGISFKDSTVTYDGTPKSLAISGTLPAGATVSYTGNARTQAGSYTVNALIKVPNHNDMSLSATLTIKKAQAIITAHDPQTFVYDGTEKKLAASLNHTETTLTYYPQQGYTATGTYTVMISAAATANYLAVADTVKLAIENGTVSGITLADTSYTYDGTPKSLAISGSLPAGGTVSYTGNAQTFAGSYTVNALIKAPNYTDVNLSATLTIKKAKAVITADSIQVFIYDGTIKNAKAALNHTETTLNYSPQQGYTAQGTYPVIISAVETANYLKAADTVSLVIGKAGLSGISLKDSAFTYNGKAHSLAVTQLPEGATVIYSNNGKTDAGTYKVTATVSLEHFRDTTLTATLTIRKAASVITAAAMQTHIADGSLKNVVASLNHKEAVLSYSPQQGYAQPGTYEITVSVPESKNYLATSQKVSLVIDKATFQGVGLSDGEFTYNGSAHHIYVWGAPEGAHITYSGNGQTNAGTYSVKALIQKENYHDLELTARIIIHKAQAYISTEPFQSHVYDGSVKNVQAWLNHSETSIVYHPQRGYTDAGSYHITLVANETPNYFPASTTVQLYIDKATFQGVSLPGKEFTYNGSPHALVVTGTPAGAEVTYTGNNRTHAGTYTVTALVQMKNYYDLELEAELIIHKAPQTISFEEIGIKHLENDTDFQLEAQSSSGLPVSYTYTYAAEEAPATVTAGGWVELHTSGYVSITAHQPGNENYLSAESVTRQLKINSSDATIHRITVGGETFETPEAEIYYLIDCADEADSIQVQLKTEVGASVVPGRSLIMDIPKPGIYKQTVVITSQDSTNTLTYHITVEKRFNFEDIGVQKFNNLFLINNNPETNGGYEFVEYEWLKNGEIIGYGQYYSVGNQVSDILDAGASYSVRMKTKEGEWLSSCTFGFRPDESFTIGLFPNPVVVGSTLNVKVSDPEEAKMRILTLTGVQVLEVVSPGGNPTEIKLPSELPAGSYILHYDNGKHRKSIPFVLEK